MTRHDKFKHIRKKGTLPPALLNNSMIQLFTSFLDSQIEKTNKEPKKKIKHDGPTSTWPCAIEGCKNPRHIETNGKVRQRCTPHQREYGNHLSRVARLKKAKRKKNALPK